MTGAAFALLVLALVVAVGDWSAVANDDTRLEYLCRPLVLVLLILAALEIDPVSTDARNWFLLGLSLTLVGDVTLMVSPKLFPFGLLLFLVADLAYVAGLLFFGVNGPRLVVGALAAGVAVLAAGPLILQGVERQQPGLVNSVRAYIGVLSALVAAAFAAGRLVALVGAGLVYVSDTMGGWNRFVYPNRNLRMVGILTYHLGQIGLVVALV